MSESTEFFEKGSLITLENGECKKIEDLNEDDFLKVRLKYDRGLVFLYFEARQGYEFGTFQSPYRN